MFADKTEQLAELFAAQISLLDPQPKREGLKETPMRAAKAFIDYTCGYYIDTEELLKTFEDGADPNVVVTVFDAPFYSLCEHHLAPFFGTATIRYKPTDRVVGLSKLVRLLNAHSRRLQVQERITADIARDILRVVGAEWVTVELVATHMCMCARGISAHGSQTKTSITLYSEPNATLERNNLR